MITKKPFTLLLNKDEFNLLDKYGYLYLIFEGKHGSALDFDCMVSYYFEEVPSSEHYSLRRLVCIHKLKEKCEAKLMPDNTVLIRETYRFNKAGLLKSGFDLQPMSIIKPATKIH